MKNDASPSYTGYNKVVQAIYKNAGYDENVETKIKIWRPVRDLRIPLKTSGSIPCSNHPRIYKSVHHPSSVSLAKKLKWCQKILQTDPCKPAIKRSDIEDHKKRIVLLFEFNFVQEFRTMLSTRTLQRAALRTSIFRSATRTTSLPNRCASFVHSSPATMKSFGLRSFSTTELPSPPTSSHPHVPLPSAKGSLIYTETDEAPALATYSLLPILSKVCIFGLKFCVSFGSA
jgi:hypothetical protein